MLTLNKIFITTLVLCYMALASVCVYGQTKIVKTRSVARHNLTIGFQTGRELLFHSSPLLHSRQSKVHYGVSNTLVLRKPITKHLSVETGIKYSTIQSNTLSPSNELDIKRFKTINISTPLSIHYSFLSDHSRVRPYLGAGLQYNFNRGNGFPPFISDINLDNKPQTGTKYISILFTEGITFQINTRIQISQSFHFIPGAEKTIGFDLGIGFNLDR